MDPFSMFFLRHHAFCQLQAALDFSASVDRIFSQRSASAPAAPPHAPEASSYCTRPTGDKVA